jgi:transposase-like protein
MQNEVQPLSPSALAGSGRSEAERSETERSADPAKAGADPAAMGRPNPEVIAKAKRRRFTAQYKQQILTKADAASEPGAIGALLRREQLYSSHLVAWRRQRETMIRKGFASQKRGPMTKRNPLADENQKLHRENGLLTEQLRKAELIIDVQKKLAALLGAPILPMDQEGQR